MTTEQEREHRETQIYGKDAADWLARWDAGHIVWSVEMGGLGPGYEQAIQITAVEILRHLLAAGYDATAWAERERWRHDRDAIEHAGLACPAISRLGLSYAQWGAALGLAAMLYRHGPRKALADERRIDKDRLIQVSRAFPGEGTYLW